MADGGEGTVAVLRSVWGGELLSIDTLDPLGRHLAAAYLQTPDGRAVVELAAAGRCCRWCPTRLDALRADSRGTGILLHHAIVHGATEVMVCLGGSASTDGGAGRSRLAGRPLPSMPGTEPAPGRRLAGPARPRRPGRADRRLPARCNGRCCATSPTRWSAQMGAAASFGPQKGATDDDIALLDAGLARLADALEEAGCPPVRHRSGAGAAGRAGGGLAAVTGAELLPRRRGGGRGRRARRGDRRCGPGDHRRGPNRSPSPPPARWSAPSPAMLAPSASPRWGWPGRWPLASIPRRRSVSPPPR